MQSKLQHHLPEFFSEVEFGYGGSYLPGLNVVHKSEHEDLGMVLFNAMSFVKANMCMIISPVCCCVSKRTSRLVFVVNFKFWSLGDQVFSNSGN